MSSNLELLHPYLKKLATELIDKCKVEHIQIAIIQTYRTFEEQAKIYSQGRTSSGKIVTNAKPGRSYHNYGLAFDVGVIENKKFTWAGEKFDKVGKLGKELGLEWGGDFHKLIDKPHFQYTFGLTIKDLLSGKKPPLDYSLRLTKPTDDFSQCVYKLFENKMLNSPSYWINSSMYELVYFEKILTTFTKKANLKEAIAFLAEKNIIDSKEYWLNSTTYSIDNIKFMLIKLANSIN